MDDQPQAGEPLPRLDLIPVFELTDQSGNTFGLNDLRGKVWVVDTIFTRCSAVCPVITGGMRDIQSVIKNDKKLSAEVQLVSISLDGDHDSPQVLSEFGLRYNADPALWKFLTGERDTVWPFVEEGLKLGVDPGPPGEEWNISHSGNYVLIDRAGVIRGYYNGLSEAGRIQLLADLRRLVQE